jgi:hypothetical protein
VGFVPYDMFVEKGDKTPKNPVEALTIALNKNSSI